MPISKIRPRGDIKTNWETVNPILQLREIGVEWESTIGEGDAKIKFGDGLTHWNDLDYAIVNNITKKIVTALAVVEEEDPELNDGEAVDTLFGKIKKKFQTIQSKIAAINTIIGVFEDITIDTGGDSEQAAENITTAINLLNTGKLTTSDIYNGLDSTNTALALSALQGKNLNDAITSLNSELENKMPATAKYFGRSVSFNGYSSLLAWAKDNQFAFNVFVSKQFDDLPISYGFVWAVGTGIYNTGIKVYCSPNNSNTLYVRTAESGDSWATEWETITPS